MSDPSKLNLSDLVNLYNGTLKSILDTHAPLMSKVVINRPSSLRYTDEIRSEKRKCRALWWPSSAIGEMSICTIFLHLFIFFNLIAILFIFYFCFVLLTNGFISILFLVQNKFTYFSSALFLC